MINKTPVFPFKTATEFLHRLETKYNLYQYEVDGWSAWAITRAQVAYSLANMSFKRPTPPFHNERFKRYAFGLKDLPKLVWLHKRRYVFRTHTSALRESKGIHYKDIFLDDLLMDMNSRDYFKIEDLNSSDFFDKRTRALIQSDVSSLLFSIVPNLIRKMGRPRYIAGIAEKLSAVLLKVPDLHDFTTPGITRDLLHFFWAKKLFGWLFDRIQPEYLVMPTHGHYPMVAAAKERKIKVIEFQHGSPNCYKVDYSWPEEATAYKSKLPIPDWIFLYGEYFRQELKKCGFWDVELSPVGSIRMEQYRKVKAKSKFATGLKRCNILVTTQGVDTQRLVRFMCEFLKIAKNHLKLRLVFKLQPHSEDDKTPYKPIFETSDQVDILLGNESPSTFELMSRSDFHMSIYSTTHFEALGLGIPTIILPFLNYEIMLHLYNSGHAFFAQTPKDLFDIIRHNPSYKIPENIRNYYLRPGALENIKKELAL
jgi:hypothetical protein